MTLYWQSWAEFWHMGGYAVYVWGAFGVAALALALELMSVRWRRKTLQPEIDP